MYLCNLFVVFSLAWLPFDVLSVTVCCTTS